MQTRKEASRSRAGIFAACLGLHRLRGVAEPALVVRAPQVVSGTGDGLP